MIGKNGGLLGVRRVPSTGSASGLWTPNEQSLAKRAGIWPPSPVVQDPDFANVSLSLAMDGTDGSTTFVDSSSNSLTPTVSGSVSISTTNPKFGTGCALFNTTGVLSYASSALFTLGASAAPFTVECWYNATTLPGTDNAIFTQRNTSGITTFEVRNWNDRLQMLIGNAGLTAWVTTSVSSPGTIVANTYHFIQLVSTGSNMYLRCDGVDVLGGTFAVPSWSNTNRPFYIGLGPDGGVVGRIDSLRVTKGVARGSTVPTAAFPTS